MISKLKWNKLDWLIVLVILVALIRLLAPDSGLHTAVHTIFHWLAIGASWLGTLVAQLLNLA